MCADDDGHVAIDCCLRVGVHVEQQHRALAAASAHRARIDAGVVQRQHQVVVAGQPLRDCIEHHGEHRDACRQAHLDRGIDADGLRQRHHGLSETLAMQRHLRRLRQAQHRAAHQQRRGVELHTQVARLPACCRRAPGRRCEGRDRAGPGRDAPAITRRTEAAQARDRHGGAGVGQDNSQVLAGGMFGIAQHTAAARQQGDAHRLVAAQRDGGLRHRHVPQLGDAGAHDGAVALRGLLGECEGLRARHAARATDLRAAHRGRGVGEAGGGGGARSGLELEPRTGDGDPALQVAADHDGRQRAAALLLADGGADRRWRGFRRARLRLQHGAQARLLEIHRRRGLGAQGCRCDVLVHRLH